MNETNEKDFTHFTHRLPPVVEDPDLPGPSRVSCFCLSIRDVRGEVGKETRQVGKSSIWRVRRRKMYEYLSEDKSVAADNTCLITVLVDS